jgi:hypothetical protein
MSMIKLCQTQLEGTLAASQARDLRFVLDSIALETETLRVSQVSPPALGIRHYLPRPPKANLVLQPYDKVAPKVAPLP